MFKVFIAVLLFTASFGACRAGSQNLRQTRAEKTADVTAAAATPAPRGLTAPPAETDIPATPEIGAASQLTGSLLRDWQLSLQTSGGIAGLGAGKLVIDSSGQAVFEERVRPNWQVKTCRADLSGDQRRRLQNLLAAWRSPENESAALPPAPPRMPVPDAFAYRLEISSKAGGEKLASEKLASEKLASEEPASIEWFDNTFEALPESNKTLIRALSEIREKIRRECDN